MENGTNFAVLNNQRTFYIDLTDEAGNIMMAHGTTVPSDAAVGFAKGCLFADTNAAIGSILYLNEGTPASADFNVVESGASNITGITTASGSGLTGGATSGTASLQVVVDASTVEIATNTIRVKDGGITTAKLADGAVTAKKLVGSEARTSTADGTGTGAITPPTAFRTFIDVTSASATNQIALPAISAATVGQEILLTVAANGYELITPASSNNTINQVDSDGTNQLDVAANTTLLCIQVSATGWVAIQVAATTITVVAPDND